jgi:hypothetical protein
MSYTPIFATKTEIMAFNKDVTPETLKLLSTEFDAAFDIIHEAIEAVMISELNRLSMTAATLATAAYAQMKGGLRLACIMFVCNFFLWLKQESNGRVVTLETGISFLQDTKILTPQIRDIIERWRIPCGGSVSPLEEGETVDADITFKWA